MKITPQNLDKLLNIDRRIIFLFVLVFAVSALLMDIKLPIKASKPVRQMYNKIEQLAKREQEKKTLPEDERDQVRSVLLISMDYDPAAKPELEPMSRAILRHALCKGVKVIGMTHNPHGQDLGERVLTESAEECGATYGDDYVYLGYKPGGATLIINMGQDFHDAFNQDYKGTSTYNLAVTRNIRSLSDLGYVISITSSSYWEAWVIFGQSRYGFDMGTGVTGVIAPDVFPFLQTGQIKGLLGGLVGAAEYESLIHRPDTATAGMRPQSAVHLLIVLLVIFGNSVYFLQVYLRRKAIAAAKKNRKRKR